MVRPGSVLEVGQLVGPVSGLWCVRNEEIRTLIHACMDRTNCTWGLSVDYGVCVCV